MCRLEIVVEEAATRSEHTAYVPAAKAGRVIDSSVSHFGNTPITIQLQQFKKIRVYVIPSSLLYAVSCKEYYHINHE